MKNWIRGLLKRLSEAENPGPSLTRDQFFGMAKDFTPSLVARVGRYTYHVSTADQTVARQVFVTGGFDQDHLGKVVSRLGELGWRDFAGTVLLDVGANIGTTAIPLLCEHGFERAVLVEPEPDNFRLLQQNLLANGLADRATTLNLALSDQEGELLFEVSPDNAGDHRVRLSEPGTGGADLYGEDARDTISVRATTFDALASGGHIPRERLGLVWIDTQGHEAQVLTGARSLLETDVPVLIEFWPYGLRRARGLETLETLIAAHYTHFVDIRSAQANASADLRPASDIRALRESLPDPDFTDILLLKR